VSYVDALPHLDETPGVTAADPPRVAEGADKSVLDVLCIGRVGVDLYPLQAGTALEDVTSFVKLLGGSATNVAVAASRLGLRSAVVTRTGEDPLGRFVRRALAEFAVDDRYVHEMPGLATPITLCEIFPPDDFPLWFYRGSTPPDLTITPADLDLDAVRSAGVLWLTATGLCREPSRSAHQAAWQARGRGRHTVLDLDFRAQFWSSEDAAREAMQQALPHVSVVVGNRLECTVATGEQDPHRAAQALLDAGPTLAIVKLGAQGAIAKTRDTSVHVGGLGVTVVNGLGAGDGFGGALCLGLLSEWPLRRTIEFANAAGAIVASRLECSTAMPTRDEVEGMLSRGQHPRSAPGRDWARELESLRAVRATDPERIRRLRRERKRRPEPAPDGRLLLVAADHPGRGSVAVRGNPAAMADRAELLRRLVIALGRPGVDGVVGTADVIDDLLLLGALEDKVVIGSMNRGGLHGAVFEFDDRFTGYDVDTIEDSALDGGKMLCRIALDDASTAATLESCGSAVTDLARRGLMAMIEPFMSSRVDGRVVHDATGSGVARAVGIASALGASSASTWLKLPVVDDFEVVVAATTLPILLLGGDPSSSSEATQRAWEHAMSFSGTRGMVVGRALLFPEGGDVLSAVDRVATLVHTTGGRGPSS
jgi:5-dehydro-2-deoxygluconokinase